MCYSALIEANFRELEKRFRAEMDWQSVQQAYELREKYKWANVPAAIDTYIIQNAKTMEQKALAKQAREHYANEVQQLKEKIKAYETDIQGLEEKIKKGSKAKTVHTKLGQRQRRVQYFKNKIEELSAISEKGAARIFPNYYAPCIVQDKNKRLVKLMRYQLYPSLGKEWPPSKYNLFNARRDRLNNSKIWLPHFGHHHAIFPFQRFYENVEGEGGKNKVIYFEAEGHATMWAAALCNQIKIQEGVMNSFAAITDDPPPEVAATGHDRCPVFIDETVMSDWLEPKGRTQKELFTILQSKTPTTYQHQLAS